MAKSFSARLEERVAKASFGPSEDLWRYREAASVLVFFDYDSLQPLGEVASSSSAKTELFADCDVTYPSVGNPRWSLRTAVRQPTLHRLLKRGSVDAALAANPDRPNTFAQKLLERLLKNYQAPPRVVRATAAFGSVEENQVLLQVVDWLSGVPEFEGKLPALDEVKQRIVYEHLLEPFRQLVGDHFAGRRPELEQLADYVGVHDAYSASESLQRAVERIFSIKERPPLFINGPGGSGKSTLIAKFVLDHATVEQSSRFPFAYLDFDRTGLIPEEPITLLFEIMRQLAIQFPSVKEQYLSLAEAWSARLEKQAGESGDSTTVLPQNLRLENPESFISEFAGFVTSLKAEDQPLLLVLDTFEEIQFRSMAYADEILDFIERLQQRVPRLRTVLSGRAEIQSDKYKLRRLAIGDFDNDAAISYLAKRGLTDSQVAQRIYQQCGGSPLVLRLAADVAKLEKVDQKGIAGLDSSWFSIFQRQSIEAVLYKRILRHVYNKRIEALAYPGLVLRIITPEVLQQVLGPACDVSVASIEDARELVKLMRERLSTILIPAAGDDDVLVHRPDMRSILLSDLKNTAQNDTKIAQQLTNIHDEAVRFYSKFSDPARRAEEIYHRLALGIDRKILSERWMDGLGPFLGSSIRELPAPSQVYLASSLKLELPDELWSSAEDEDWILYASRVVDQMLGLQKPFDALEVLRQRRHLWSTEGVQPVITKVTQAVFDDYARQYEELRATNPGGGPRTRMMNLLVAQIIRTAGELYSDGSRAEGLFAIGTPGKRLVAIAIADAHPTPSHMDLAIAAIKNSLSPFEQYNALQLARNLFDEATSTQRKELLDALRIQEGVPIHESDLSRITIKNDLLKNFSRLSIFSIEVIRAGKGDCLILHYGTPDKPRFALVDGGSKGVYEPYLRPRLQQISASCNLSKSESLPLDLLMISHADADHMQGILELTRELTASRAGNQPQLVQVRSLWHNSLEDIIQSSVSDVVSAFADVFGSGSSEADPLKVTNDLKNNVLGEQDVLANLQVLMSIRQGASLRNDAAKLNVQVNPEFGGDLIASESRSGSVAIVNGLKLTVISPLVRKLKQFQRQHQNWLQELAAKRLPATDLLKAYIDVEVPNLSSIVVMAEVNGKRILLTGDATSDTIFEGLENARLLDRSGKIYVDVLKIPNHGSSHNLAAEFFENVTADHYIISGNGEHGYPDRESFEMIKDARGADEYTIHLTYPVEEIDAARKRGWEMDQFQQRAKTEAGGSKPRRDWFPSAQSLKALLDGNPEFARKIRIVPRDQPHVINLLEVVGI